MSVGPHASPPLSIRARLMLAVAAVLMATLVLSGVVLIRGTRATLVDQVDEQVMTFARRSEGRKPPPPETDGNDEGDELDLDGRQTANLEYSATGELRWAYPSGFSDDPDPLPQVPDIPSPELDAMVGRLVTVPSVDDSLRYRMLVQREPDGAIQVTAAPLTEVDDAISRLVRLLVGVGVVALVGATAVSWWLIRRSLRPVDRMVDTAATIAAGDLSQRVIDADPRTELGRLGRALNEMLHQIERAVAARADSEHRLRRFVADAAHELRTPLTSLRGYAELYRRGGLPDAESVGVAMGRIESEGARMAQLVDDLLLLARLDQQRGLERKPVDVGALVADAVADFLTVQPERPVSDALERDVVVSGDRLRLRQVVDNLLANVRTHTPAGTAVHVSVKREADEAVIVVADEGPGIAPEDQAHIFDRFWRGGPARLRSGGGTGLGLAIVASLVEAHGGSVTVTSEPSRGSTFVVRLPLAEPREGPDGDGPGR